MNFSPLKFSTPLPTRAIYLPITTDSARTPGGARDTGNPYLPPPLHAPTFTMVAATNPINIIPVAAINPSFAVADNICL